MSDRIVPGEGFHMLGGGAEDTESNTHVNVYTNEVQGEREHRTTLRSQERSRSEIRVGGVWTGQGWHGFTGLFGRFLCHRFTSVFGTVAITAI